MNQDVQLVVDSVLDQVEFTPPVELEDVMAVHDAISANLPKGARLEIYHRITEVVVEVRLPGAPDPVVRRKKKVLEQA